MKKGSVKRLPSGKWMLIYDEPRVLVGKRNQHYETVSVKTEAQARRLLGKRLDTIEAGEFEAPSKMTFGELLDHYFDARKGRLQETTLALYRRTFNHHVRPKIGDVRLDKLTRDHVERVLDTARDCSTRKRKGQPLAVGRNGTLPFEYNLCSNGVPRTTKAFGISRAMSSRRS